MRVLAWVLAPFKFLLWFFAGECNEDPDGFGG